MLHSSSFFGKGDLPMLINNVVRRKEGAQEAFLEAIPLFLEEIGEEDARKTLVPFIINWFDFSNLIIAKKIFKIIPFFIHKSQSSLILLDFLFIINEIIRLNSILIDKEAMELCGYLMQIYDNTVFDSYLIPSLDRLYGQESVDAMGLALALQARLAVDSAPDKKKQITDNLLRVAKIDTCYLRMILLKNLKSFCFIADDVEAVIDAVLVPCFTHEDYKLRARSLSGLESIAETYFAINENVTNIAALGSDANWSVRYSFARTAHKLIEFASNKDELGRVLFKLCSDKVHEVKSQALFTLSESTKFLSASVMDSVPIIFDKCMRTQSETVRNGAIKLWGALLVDHPDASFHARLNKSLGLIATVPIHSFIHEMLKQVVTKLPESAINFDILNKAISTLLDTQDRPGLTLNALEVLRLFTKSKPLQEYTKTLSTKIRPLLDSPVFAVRCEAGYFFVDCTKEFGWEWANEWFIDEIKKELSEGRSSRKISAMRIATAILSIDPPDDLSEQLRELLVELTKQSIEVVKINSDACLERLNSSS